MKSTFAALLMFVALLAAVIMAATDYSTSRDFLNAFTFGLWILTVVVLISCLPRSYTSISFIYFLCFSIFHVGLVIATTFSAITDTALLSYTSSWLYTDTSEFAIKLVNIGCSSYALSVLIYWRKLRFVSQNTISDESVNRITHIGGSILIVAVAVFGILMYITGAYAFYGAYLIVMRNSPVVAQIVSWLYVFIGLSVVLVTSCYELKSAKLYILVFAVWGLFAFQLGLRGEVMFPAMVGLCLVARQRRVFNAVSFAAVLLVFLVASGVVRNARVGGDYGNFEYISPVNTVAELGGSLRSVYETVRWRESGDEFMYGQSYWAPFERQLALIVPGIDRPPAVEDDRLLNVVIQERAGPYGYSPVAEAYRNFGIFGVAAIMFLMGTLLSQLDRLPPTTKSSIYIGAILVPFFIQIRNSFAPVPVQILVSVSVCWVVIAMARVRLRV